MRWPLYGAELIETDSMEAARDQALAMQAAGEGLVLDQFNNPDNKQAHSSPPAPKSGHKPKARSPIS